MRTIRCQRCRQMFEYEGLPPPCCPLCAMARNSRFARVRELVKELPGITAMEAHQQTGVPLAEIMEYLRDGDTFVEAGTLSYTAEKNLNEFRNYIGGADLAAQKAPAAKRSMSFEKVKMDTFQIGKKR